MRSDFFKYEMIYESFEYIKKKKYQLSLDVTIYNVFESMFVCLCVSV